MYLQLSETQGLVVQSVVSLTSLLRVILLTVLADSIHNILIFFAEKMWVAFALLLTFFQQKISAYICICVSVNVIFNESLTNDVVSFEQMGPGVWNFRTSTVICFAQKWLEMCQYVTDAPAKGPSSPGHKHLQKNEVEKMP